MRFYISFVLTCFVFKSADGIHNSKISNTVTDLLNGLALEKWDREESACRLDTEAILKGIKNNTLWAAWIWDSMQLPVGTFSGSSYHLGNFDQCLKVPWTSHQKIQTQYCLLDVKLTALNKYDGKPVDPYDDAEKYISMESQYGKRLNTIHMGVCLPATCKPESIVKISRHIFSLSHLPLEDITVDPRDCQVAGSVAKPTGFYVFWFIVMVMVFICTFVYFFVDADKSDSKVSKIGRCFCLSRNFDALTECNKDDIKVIRGIRALTCGILTGGHLFYMSQTIYFNHLEVKEIMFDEMKINVHLDLCVDTFLVLSGLLHCRGLMSSRSYQPLKTLLKRYLRLLLPLYALSIACMTYVMPYVGSGPAWPRFTRSHFEPCAKSWWRNFLMITNKVDSDAICSEIGWQVSCDFKLTVFCTLIFMVYHQNKTKGFVFCSLAFILSVVTSVTWIFWQELPGTIWYDFGESLYMSTNKKYMTVYTSFYTRVSTYLIGVTMGYMMSVYKPQNYRNTISKTNSVLGFILGMSLMLMSLGVGTLMFKKELTGLVLAVFATLDKTVWSIGICIIIISCEYGTLPIINNFLGSIVFVPLGKLSYASYLFHTMFLYRDLFSLRTPVRFETLEMITHTLGYVVISISTCYLIWLFIEAPVTNLINLLFDFNRCSKVQEGEFKEVSQAKESEKKQKML